MSLISNTAVQMNDGGGRRSETLDDFELATPVNLTEVLDEVTDYFSSGYHDFADALIQLKSVAASVDESEVFKNSIVKEAVSLYTKSDISEITQKFIISDFTETDINKIIADKATEFYERFNDFGDYTINIQVVIALIEETLRDELSEEEYNAFIQEIGEENSLERFMDSTYVEKHKYDILKRFRNKIPTVFSQAGLDVLYAIKAGDMSVFTKEKTIELLKKSAQNYLNGRPYTPPNNGVGKARSPLTQKLGKIGGKLAIPAIYLAILTATDIKNDEFTFKHEVINVGRAGVLYLSGAAGTAVSTYLSSTVVGSFAGPIGTVVAVGVGVVGNIALDVIKDVCDYTFNDIPRDYKELSISKIKSQLEDNGYQLEAPKIEGFPDKSAYDIVLTKTSHINNDAFKNYVFQSCTGVEVMNSYETSNYNLIMRYIMTSGVYDDTTSLKRMVEMSKGSLTADEEAFIDAYCDMFLDGPGYFKKDPEIMAIYNIVTNNCWEY